MKALLVGGTGPTGPHVVARLRSKGYEVAILHRGTHEIDLPADVEHLHGDPHFLESLESILGKRSFDLVISMYGRLRIVAQAMKERTPRFIGIGGTGVYPGWIKAEQGRVPLPLPVPESCPLQDDPHLDHLGYMMVMSEQTVMQAHREGAYNATILRYPVIYGPRQLGAREWSIVRRILDGRKHIILPDGGTALEHKGYTENMAHAVMLAVEKPESSGQIYNVGDETVLTIKQWVETIARLMGHQWEIVEMPYRLARPSRPYSGRTHHRVLDLAKIRTELGYKELVPVEEALRRTVAWLVEHRPDPDGEVERQLQDPFDYAAEDHFIKEYQAAVERILVVPFNRERWRHPYDHPKVRNA
ncbi:MAG: NAD-dependent epimerase/dehydratase family protein [Chloroflexi bacterium]|nr:NAD-dependent epimerase/dehydratase family protein [Chloroflexota bacterium]